MANELGIENVKKFVGLGIKFGKQYETAMEDKKFTSSDAWGFLDELLAVPEVMQHSKEFIAESLDIVGEERTELNTWAEKEFDLKNDEVEEKVEAAIDWVLSNLKLYKVFKKV